MYLIAVPAVLSFLPVHLPGDFATNSQIVLRWLHILAGITWVGLGYFLVLVGMPWQHSLEPTTRAAVATPLIRKALWWHRWASVVTVLVGIWIWMVEVGTDRRAAEQESSSLIWSFFVIWTLAYFLYMGVMMSPLETLRKGAVLAVITAALMIAASYAYLQINSHGWETNRVLAIGIGGGIGWFMMLNLWGLIWRIQKRMLAGIESGSLPPQSGRMARQAVLAARTNAWLSLPMLFFMAVASHYPMFGMLS